MDLTIEADSLDTGNRKRDQHLRSADFFSAERHPQVRFVSETAVLNGDMLKVSGRLHAAGKSIPLELDATVAAVDGDLQIDAIANAAHRETRNDLEPARDGAPDQQVGRKRTAPADPRSG